MMVEDAELVKWSWEVVELTSKPENVVSRFPSSDIVGVLVLSSSVIFFIMTPAMYITHEDGLDLLTGMLFYGHPSRYVCLLLCGDG